MKNFYLLLVLFVLTAFVQNVSAQNISNEGTEFWTVFPTHDPSGSSLATMNVNITAKSNSEVTVSCGTYSETQVIPANTVITFLVPRPDSYIDYDDANQLLTNRGIHIVVKKGKPKVVAYSHVFAGNRSAATLILPYDALGQKYYSMNYTQDNSSTFARNFLVLVAVEDNTDIIINEPGGTKKTVKLLKAGDVYEYMPATHTVDLTGVYVDADQSTSACKRFAAFSGSTSLGISCFTSRDPLLQQLYTVNSWGKVYGVVPFINRQYAIRVLAQEDNTTVTLDGASIGVINKGQYLERILIAPSIVSADKLISVAEYAMSQNCSSTTGSALPIGDPEMVLLNPVEFNIKNITVFSSDKNLIREKYLNVFMKTAKIGSFKINGAAPMNGIWRPMPSDPSYSCIQVQVYDASLTLTADDGFNAIAYGFGNTESYAYSAGTNLASSQFLVFVNKTSKTENSSACIGQNTDFKLTMPYQLSKITWKFSDGTPDFVDNNPVAVVSTVSGQTSYTYTSPVNKVFNAVGSTTLTAIATLANSTSTCITGELELDFTIEVNALAIAAFTMDNDICLGAPTSPKDNSTAGTGGPILKWKWTFDTDEVDGQTPTYTFKTIGTHTVKLSVQNSSGCWTDAPPQVINIKKYLPVITFAPLAPVCINSGTKQFVALEALGLNATDKSFSGPGVSASGLFNPATAGVGVHKITYTFTSTDGCVNTATQNIEVYALPKITLDPIVYILSGGQKMLPAVVPNSNAKYKYKWTPSTGLSKDDILNPIASPDVDTEYQLAVTVDDMCEVTAKILVKVLGEITPPNSFTPNGDGVNDLWNIKSIDSYPDATVEVFTRDGQKVFNSIGYSVPFDGTFQNKPLPVGVYYYIVNPKNGRKAITGPLTIIR